MLIWSRYVNLVAGHLETGSAIARHIKEKTGMGPSQPTVSRWMNGTYVPDKPAEVANFARAFRRDVLEAFVAAGMLTLTEASRGLSKESMGFLASLNNAPYSTRLPVKPRTDTAPDIVYPEFTLEFSDYARTLASAGLKTSALPVILQDAIAALDDAGIAGEVELHNEP